MSTARMLSIVLLLAAGARGDEAKQSPLVSGTVTQYSALYLGDPGLQQELALTPEQRQQLQTMLPPAFHNFLARGENAAKRDADSAELAKQLAGLLKPEQQARLRQVVLQQLAGIPAGPGAIALDAEVVKQLALSDPQLKQLQSRTLLAKVLTAAQQKSWKEIVGMPYPDRLVLRGIGAFPYGRPPDELRMLNGDWLATELQLSDEQKQKIDDLTWEWANWFPELSHEFELKSLEADFLTRAKAILTPAQQQRLAQIVLQRDAKLAGVRSIYEQPAVIEALKLSPEQQEKIIALRRERRAGAMQLFLAGDPPAVVREKLAKYDAETPPLIAKLAGDEQQAQVAKLLGEAIPAAAFFRIQGGLLSYERYEALPPSYLPGFALYYGAMPVVHERLKLDAAKAKALTALPTEFKAPPGGFLVPSTDDAKQRLQEQAIEKRLGEILSAAELRELKQLVLRNWPFQANLDAYLSPHLAAAEEFMTAMKFTPQQLRRLDRGALVGEVLNETQRKTWTELVGAPVAHPAPPTNVVRQIPLFPYGNVQLAEIYTLMNPYVLPRLKLTADQSKTISAIVQKIATQPMQVGGDEETQLAQMTEALKRNADGIATVTKTLDETQRKELRKLTLRDCRDRTYPIGIRFYLLPEIAAGMKLSPEQLAAVRSQIDEFNELSAMLQALPRPEPSPTGDDVYVTQAEIMKRKAQQLRDALTAEQKTALAELLGDEPK